MTTKNISINGQTISVNSPITDSEFEELYRAYVSNLGGNQGVGVMGKMGWDASHRNGLRKALLDAQVVIEKNPPEILPGFEIDSAGRLVRINRDQFP